MLCIMSDYGGGRAGISAGLRLPVRPSSSLMMALPSAISCGRGHAILWAHHAVAAQRSDRIARASGPDGALGHHDDADVAPPRIGDRVPSARDCPSQNASTRSGSVEGLHDAGHRHAGLARDLLDPRPGSALIAERARRRSCQLRPRCKRHPIPVAYGERGHSARSAVRRAVIVVGSQITARDPSAST
jgi:hypothetical protein